MKFEKKYLFKTWNDWNHAIAFSSEDFYSQFHYYPNYLLANDYTLSQIDFIASIRPDISPNKIGSFSNEEKGYDISFCIENELLNKEFTLVFDDEADKDAPIVNLPKSYPVRVLPKI